jgi:uncharacterized protein involved in response to NO
LSERTHGKRCNITPSLPVLADGFRLFFLFAGLDAVFNMAVWLAIYFHPDAWPADAIAPIY